MVIEPGKPWVMIPTCGESPHLGALLRKLCPDTAVTVVINNMTDSREALALMADCVCNGADVKIWEEPANIYQIWNWAIQTGQEQMVSSVSILNDDIDVPPLSVWWIDGSLRQCESLAVLGWDCDHPGSSDLGEIRYVSGTYRKHGVPGFAFAVKPHRVPFIDERFNWWGGDDDLILGAAAMGGRLGVLTGCGVAHHTSTSASARPWVYEGVADDRQLLFSKWGDAW